MTEHEQHEASDYLWDPQAMADPRIAHLERALCRFGAGARGVLDAAPRPSVATRRRRLRRGLALPLGLAATALLALAGAHQYRLSWPDGAAWSATLQGAAATLEQRQLRPGDALQTGAAQHARLEVARIGQLVAGPSSELRLLTTRSGQHRIALDRGRLHARIWAPPGYFGVVSGNATIIDHGCEFELQVEDDGSGSLAVLSGWVGYDLPGAGQTMVPAGHVLLFDGRSAGTPLRDDVDPALRAAVVALQSALLTHADRQVLAMHADEVARQATDADFHSLLSLLTRHPSLAASEIYPRLAGMLGSPADPPTHRAAWQRGDLAAINAWWDRVPVQPKSWWRHWRDALPIAATSPSW